MTGRYNYRSGVVDTYLGRSLMFSDEVTLPELLKHHKSGIFGKWHLGDNYPMRPMDQGFSETLIHKGGGIGQPSDPPGGESYFDPVLQKNGRPVKSHGYCSDIFTDAAIRFIEENQTRPFFVWLAFNAPHSPLQVPDKYLKRFAGMELNDNTARTYAMIENVDENLGRLLARLESMNLHTNTIVIFLTDNGPAQSRFNAGLRGQKGTVFEGGIRVPFFIRVPGQKPRVIDRIAAHIDLAPTLLEALDVPAPRNVDGRSLWPLITSSLSPDKWPDRNLFFQWHRGDTPELRRSFAIRSQRYKLVRNSNQGAFQLFDIERDPNEREDIGNEHLRTSMLDAYERWFKDVTATRAGALPHIVIGGPENPSILTPQDWTGPDAGWTETSIGHWRVSVLTQATFTATARFRAPQKPATVHLSWGDSKVKGEVPIGSTSAVLPAAQLEAGEGTLHCWLEIEGQRRGVTSVELMRH